MLLPALGQARERAKGANCLGNLKQIGLGVAGYFQDFDEWFRSGDASTANTADPVEPAVWAWSCVLAKYGYIPYDRANPGKGVMFCPGAATAINYTKGLWNSYGAWYSNGSCANRDEGRTALSTKAPAIRRAGASRISLVADSWETTTGSNSNLPSFKMAHKSANNYSTIYLQHADRANTVFLDGHAAAASEGDIAAKVGTCKTDSVTGKIIRITGIAVKAGGAPIYKTITSTFE
jgi:prepilin-type processing-associated H-X9-DG protein